MVRKKKNKVLPLLILVGVLVVFIIAYSILKSANDKAEADRLAEEAAQNQTITIAAYEASELSSLSYTLAGEDAITFKVSDEGEWYLSNDKNFPLNEELVSAMANSVISITASRPVTEGELSDYGLDAPILKISVRYSDDSHEYRVGNYNNIMGAYYFLADGEMYLVSTNFGYYFNYDLDSLMVLDTVPTDIEADYINSVTVKIGGTERVYSEAEDLSTLESLIRSIPLKNCADYYADESELQGFGITGDDYITVDYKALYQATDSDGNTTSSRLNQLKSRLP